MSFQQKCPQAPKACLSHTNPSWSPAIQSEQGAAVPFMALDLDSSYPYHVCYGRLLKREDIIAPELLAAIKQDNYLFREIKESWWSMVEDEQEPFAVPGDSFLVRRDKACHDILVKNPTEEERSTLKHKKLFMKNEMGYFRSVLITMEYGSTYDGNQRWTRRAVAYLQDDVSPYPFQKDCRPEHHKNGFIATTFSS
jgi:hypothetical protein